MIDNKVGASPGPLTVRGAQGGLDSESFALLYEKHAKALWGIAAGVLGDRTQAHDVVQEAAMIALDKLNSFTPGTSFVAWMGQIVRFAALNERRRGVARPQQPLVESGAAFPADRPGSRVAKEDEFETLVRPALAVLDETARTCLVLRLANGMSYQDIAAALGIPEGTAMSHVHRARKSLHEVVTAKRRHASAGRERA